MAPSRNIHISDNQKEVLLQYMREHPEFADLNWAKSHRAETKLLWDDLGAKLNSYEGATKEPRCWRESWHSWKLKVRIKAQNIQANKEGLPGAKPAPTKITDIEERLLMFLGEGELIGKENTCDSLPFILMKLQSSHTEEVGTEISYETIDCTIDEYETQLQDDDSRQSSPSAQPQGSDAQLYGTKRTAESKCEDAKRSRLKASGPSRPSTTFRSVEERTLLAAEDTARSLAALVALGERYAEATERTAGAAERRARAAERLADAAERQALLAESAARKAAKR